MRANGILGSQSTVLRFVGLLATAYSNERPYLAPSTVVPWRKLNPDSCSVTNVATEASMLGEQDLRLE